nr:capsular polysaccharide biosynthesis protein [Paracoccaceae bacterium]
MEGASPPSPSDPSPAAAVPLHVYSGGFLRRGRVRRILELSGYRLRLGLPAPGGLVAVWGATPVSARGRAVAARRGAGLLTVEDAFLRSVRPGRAGDPPLGLILDREGVHFDPSRPSALERLLAGHPLDDPALLDRARMGMARLRATDLSKYNDHDPAAEAPAPGYVLVIDQTLGDASVAASGADRTTFAAMLAAARREWPGAAIWIKTHPETRLGLRQGHFGRGDEDARVRLLAEPLSPRALLDGATAVYTVSSQLGFEAILAGHSPRVFGQPFYAGWGLTQDERPLPRR